MTLLDENKIQELERKINELERKLDSLPIDKLVRKMDSEKNLEFSGGKFQKHLRDYIDIDNLRLGKTRKPYQGIILESPDDSSWLIEVDNNGDLDITKQ